MLGTATAFAVLATILGGIAQNRVPGDARWTSIGTYPEFWIALVSGMIAAGLVASSSVLARWFGSAVQRRSVAGRDRALIMAYLRARINAWNTPDWGFEVPSAVERRLTVTTVDDGRERSKPRILTEEAALDGRRMLVILGGPGAGKTWLARRYARRSAEAALALLDGGAELAEVELPVYTTWDHWAQLSDAGGDGVRAGLVASSFGANVHHGGGETADTVAALRDVLNRDQTRVLFVIDSLDEATGKDHGPRLGNLTGLADQQARVVITSRPGAWDRVRNRTPVLDDTRLVAELRDLSYPEDVEAFVGDWFEHDPERARAMTDQLRTREDVARSAVVPLILTFYCLVAADRAPSAPLPARRHDLYDRIIAQSLARANKNVGADPDYRYTERVSQLRAWAWHAVGASNTPAGLGDWGETFVPTSPPSVEDHLALDALAPRMGVTRERTVRRFQHRTILEHLVAEHLATLGTDEAAEILVPHLWFDPDWEGTAPAALAAHNRARPGELLDRILEVMNPLARDGGDFTLLEVKRGVVRVVLVAAADSEPDEWTTGHNELIAALRFDSFGWAPELSARTAHWPRLPHDLVARRLDQMTTVYTFHDVARLRRWLPALIASKTDRDHAAAVVFDWISQWGGTDLAADLADTFARLGPSDSDRGRALTVLLDRIGRAGDTHAASSMADALRRLGPSDRDRTVTAIFDRIASSDYPPAVGVLAEVLAKLEPSDSVRARAFSALFNQISAYDSHDLFLSLAHALPLLVMSDRDRDRAFGVVLDRIASTYDGKEVNALAEALTRLGPSDTEHHARACALVLDRIASIDGYLVVDLAYTLTGLGPSDSDRARACAVVLDRMTTSVSSYEFGRLAWALPGLIASDSDRARARTVVLDRMTATDGFHEISGLAGVLKELGPSDSDRARARAALVDQIAGTLHSHVVAHLAMDLLGLGPSDSDRARVLTAVSDQIAKTDNLESVQHLAEALPGLITSDSERARTLTVVFDRIGSIDKDEYAAASAVASLAETLPVLVASNSDRARALNTVLDWITRADDGRQLGRLAETVPGIARGLPDPLNELRRHTTLARRRLPAALVGPVRTILACSDWLGLLPKAPQL